MLSGPPRDYSEPEQPAKPVRSTCYSCLAIAIAGLLLWVGLAYAHQASSGMAYSPWCCSGNAHNGDCAPIPASSVRIVGQSYVVTLLPGQHRKVTKPHTYIKPISEALPSTDGEYHACLHPTEDKLRCLIAPEGAV